MVNTSFGKFAREWDEKVGNDGVRSSQETVKAIFQFLGKVKNKVVYEIACGNGFLARKLAKSGTKEVWASDIARELIDIAKNKYSRKGIKYSVRESADFIGIPKNHFDAVIIHQGMFFIKDIEALIKGVSKILKPSGSFIFTLLHPLFPDARKAMNETTAMGDNLDDLIEMQEKYLKTYSKVVNKDWGNRKVSYLIYKRPVSFYVNLCGKYGLYVEAMIEPKSETKKNNKIAKTNIPSSMIIKAIKVRTNKYVFK